VPALDRNEHERRRNANSNQVEIVDFKTFRDDKLLLFFEERDVQFNETFIGAIVDAMLRALKVMLVVTNG
jgi:hypothetical protein